MRSKDALPRVDLQCEIDIYTEKIGSLNETTAERGECRGGKSKAYNASIGFFYMVTPYANIRH